MNKQWLAALAAGLLTAAPASALEIWVDPAPIYVFDLSPDRGIYDVLLQNILVLNDADQPVEMTGLRVELFAKGELLSSAHIPATKISARAVQFAGLDQAGVLSMMDFQFHLSRLLPEGARLSSDANLEPQEAYLNSGLYVASSGLPDTARITVEGPGADLGQVEVPVSRYQSPTTYRAPVNGRWMVISSADAAQHHRWVLSSEFAIDIVRMRKDFRSHKGTGERLTDYATFGALVLAAADGVVVAARDDRPDNAAMMRRPDEAFEAYLQRVMSLQQAILAENGFEGAAGNHLLIRHASGEYALYAHLREGSLRVKAGDEVRAGETIAQAGSSGNSTEPHLHFQIIDGPDLNSARGIPFEFSGLKEDWISMQHRHLRAGDVIEQE